MSLTLIVGMLTGLVLLIVSTDQFVTGAGRVASGLHMSTVVVGAVILGCGTALPELALAFHGSRSSPLHLLFHFKSNGHSTGLLIFVLIMAIVLTIPVLFPNSINRHSPLVLIATIAFATSLRGSLDRFEGFAMILGFILGITLITRSDRTAEVDPYAPPIDDYDIHGAYIEAPVMTPVQAEMTRTMCGLLGTAVGAQLLALSAETTAHNLGYGSEVYGLIFVVLGSLLPHVVVAFQALRHHHEGLAVGNLIGSNLFHSLAIGGLVSIVRPYVENNSLSRFSLIGIALATATLTWMLLHTEDELSQRQGLVLLSAYVTLVVLAVS